MMGIWNACFLFVSVCLASPLSGSKSPIVQRAVHYSPDRERANAVKEAFQFAWDGYYQYAFPNDELHPESNGYGNSRSGGKAHIVEGHCSDIRQKWMGCERS
jgi:mannosyl-oligosaccharide alpha-1,2-mannosidase